MSPVPEVKKNSGQSLLEVTIVIGLVVIVLMALSSVVIHGLETSQVAQNQAQATKLASQGLDIVRNIRDTGGTVCISSSVYRWKNNFWSSSGCTGSAGSSCYFKIDTSGVCSDDPSPTNPLLNQVSASTFETISSQFTRQIKTDPVGSDPNQIRVTSTVYWTDYSGPHSTSQVTILANI